MGSGRSSSVFLFGLVYVLQESERVWFGIELL